MTVSLANATEANGRVLGLCPLKNGCGKKGVRILFDDGEYGMLEYGKELAVARRKYLNKEHENTEQKETAAKAKREKKESEEKAKCAREQVGKKLEARKAVITDANRAFGSKLKNLTGTKETLAEIVTVTFEVAVEATERAHWEHGMQKATRMAEGLVTLEREWRQGR